MATAVIAVAWDVKGLSNANPAAVAPTVWEKPQTIAGVYPLEKDNLEAWTIAALPIPTQIAAATVPPPSNDAANRDKDAIIIPVILHKIEVISPLLPPPTAKKDAQAVNVIQTGTGSIVAVRRTSSPPSTPMLTVKASDCFNG